MGQQTEGQATERNAQGVDVLALVAEWRAEAANPHTGPYEARVFSKCADELDAVLGRFQGGAA